LGAPAVGGEHENVLYGWLRRIDQWIAYANSVVEE
jgi:hypothetical protein